MLHFRSKREAEEAELAPAVRKVVLSRIEEFERALVELNCSWNAEDDGWFSLLELAELAKPLQGMGWKERLAELLFEDVFFHEEARLWECLYIPGNNWGWTAFVPDAEELPGELRELFLRETSSEKAELARSKHT